jgi:hypothetical protein
MLPDEAHATTSGSRRVQARRPLAERGADRQTVTG